MQCSGGRVLMEHDSSLVDEVLARGEWELEWMVTHWRVRERSRERGGSKVGEFEFLLCVN
jgi:hypothetical protein